ncbi:DUF4294 domain-containing protein [Crocinitomicaceae bacterium]|nr:DUF4294 domain-containing protein [Crocinitomicaceae bacterium]
MPEERYQEMPEVRVDKDFALKYQRALNEIKRVYTLALQAKVYLVEFEVEYQTIEKKRKQKKYGKQAHKILKDQFIYDIRDLYISQGIMLMKLVHRETGQTVTDIVSKYRGQIQANLYEEMGKIWEQDLGVEYDPYGDDWITEIVILDIIKKRVPFDWELKPLDKETFKENQKAYRKTKKIYRKKERKYKKVKRQTKRAGSKS